MPEVPFPDMMDGDNFELMGLCLRSVTLKFGSKIVVKWNCCRGGGRKIDTVDVDVWGKGLNVVCGKPTVLQKVGTGKCLTSE